MMTETLVAWIIYGVSALLCGIVAFASDKEEYQKGQLTPKGILCSIFLTVTPIVNSGIVIGMFMYVVCEHDNRWNRWWNRPIRTQKGN